jgi:hypothetical protein
MLNSTMRVLTIACIFVVAVLAAPAISTAGIFGCHSCAAPAVAAPACATCAPPTVSYMPTVVYRALYQPAVATNYQPVAPCNSCAQPVASYGAYTTAYTTYRPVFGGWAYRPSLVPYTAYYRPSYYAAMPMVTYAGCSSCASYTPCNSCSPCAGGSCASGGCGTVSYETPASGCASCAASTTVITSAPSNGSSQSPPRTFQEERTQRPAADVDLKPIPRAETQFNSMPAPLLPDPKDRTASRSDYSSSRVRFVASPVQASTAQDNDGWQPARD